MSKDWALIETFRVPHYDRPDVDYLWRLRIISTPWFGVYLHKINTPDPRDTLHSHPWTFVSFILKGGYVEAIQPPPGSNHYADLRPITFINLKRLRDWHWIDSLVDGPVWTLMFVGRRRRTWGYLDRDGTFTDFDKHPFNEEFERALRSREQEK